MRVPSIAVGPLESLRKRSGQAVSLVPDWMNLGNVLYQGVWAVEGRAAGKKRYLLRTPVMEQWREHFPRFVDELTLPRERLPRLAERLKPWENEDRQPSNLFYDSHALNTYIRDYLVADSALAESEPLDPETLVLNIRRGDYFSVGRYHDQFGIDSVTYARTALDQAIETGGAPRKIHVVSDGISWCQDNLGFLTDIAPVEYQDNPTPFKDLTTIARAQRLIITNSTFSYWGGYIGDALATGREVWAPVFFCRSESGWERTHHLRPGWHVVENIPGGWDAPPAFPAADLGTA